MDIDNGAVHSRGREDDDADDAKDGDVGQVPLVPTLCYHVCK